MRLLVLYYSFTHRGPFPPGVNNVVKLFNLIQTKIAIMEFLIALLVLTGTVFSVQARCKMRSDCAMVGGFEKPCPVNHEALPFITDDLTPVEVQEFGDMFVKRCPTLAVNETGHFLPYEEILTCCDHLQVQKFDESLTIAEGVLGRCPACLRNFQRQICEMNCSPNQSEYIDVEIATTTDGTETEYVNVVNYRIYEEFMEGAFDSCSGVIVPQTGLPAVNMMCGAAPVCNAEAWFAFTGDTTTNPLVPVHVNFLKWPTPEDSMSFDTLACNETFLEDLPCSCIDCQEMCPLGGEPVVPSMCTVLGLNCIAFSTAIVFFVLTVTIFSVLTVLEYKKSRNVQTKPHTSKPQDVGKLVSFFQIIFARVGLFSVRHPAVVLMLTSWLSFGMLFGVLNIQLTANPIELWSSPEARGRQDLEYFNSRFGPFYRPTQILLTISLDSFEFDNITYGPAFRLEAIKELIKLEDAIYDIGRSEGGVVLEDVCYAPNRLPGAANELDQCVSMSISTYIGDDRYIINNNTYLTLIRNCINNHFGFGCLAPWGGGAEPEIVFGGYDDDVFMAHTLLISLPLSNEQLQENLQNTLEWEAKFLELMADYDANWKSDFVDVAYQAERSIEDEIERISLAEAVTIAISYAIMFIYVILALGNVRSCKTFFIDSKIMVAVGSILIVLNSIFCALGTMGYFSIVLSLFAINVIPFFILSVGIDNVFLMVNTLQDIQNNLKQFDDYQEDFSFSRKRDFVFEKMLIRIGPSIFVSSVTQITCFSFASMTNFPAIYTFAVFASISLGFLFVFQITVVLALLSIDYSRANKNRFDVLCCIQKKILNDDDPLNATGYKSVTQKLMEPYSKFIVDWRVKIFVAILFMGMASASVVLIPQIEVGLDQELAIPRDSYVYKYLVAIANYLKMGPPVYFVLKSGLNFTDINHQNAICGGQLCNNDSLTTQIYLASLYSNVTYMSRSSNSWLDDFIDWSNLFGVCCRYNTTDNGFCQSTDMSDDCSFCSIDRYEWSNGLRPHPESFERYIPFFLQDQPSETCNKGGLASYAAGVTYILDSEGRAQVQDTNFMAYHVPLSTSADFINAVRYGYEISENITRSIKENTGVDVEVFAYSVFYPFFEQYLTIWRDSFLTILYSIIGAIFFNLLASGFSITTTFTVMFTSILVFVDMMGIMYLWNIPLNPVSNMNLIVSVGIAVEFCSHIAYAFITSQKPPNERVQDAVQSVGATIITGITFTNIPIIVLAFSYTEVLEVFFFRMFFSIVLLSFLHGMVFYPVLLSYVNDLTSRRKSK